jgi:hypothetical protein
VQAKYSHEIAFLWMSASSEQRFDFPFASLANAMPKNIKLGNPFS